MTKSDVITSRAGLLHHSNNSSSCVPYSCDVNSVTAVQMSENWAPLAIRKQYGFIDDTCQIGDHVLTVMAQPRDDGHGRITRVPPRRNDLFKWRSESMGLLSRNRVRTVMLEPWRHWDVWTVRSHSRVLTKISKEHGNCQSLPDTKCHVGTILWLYFRTIGQSCQILLIMLGLKCQQNVMNDASIWNHEEMSYRNNYVNDRINMR